MMAEKSRQMTETKSTRFYPIEKGDHMADKTVLVVEDNPMNMQLSTDLLQIAGYGVIQAQTAEKGIELAKDKSPALILMDISLPGMDGLEASRMLKNDPDTRKIPIVALTAHAMKSDEERVFAAGCDGFITKPIDTRAFKEVVARFASGGAAV